MVALAAWFPSGAGAAMCIRLAAEPEKPAAGARAVVSMRTYAPYTDGLRPWRVPDYPFRVEAVAPTGRVFRLVMRSGRENRWTGSFRFRLSGVWTIRVKNFGPLYAKGCGEVLRLRVTKPR